MVKDAFSDDVHHHFSVNYTTLETEGSKVLGFTGPIITPSLSKGTTPPAHEKSDQVDQAATSEVFLDFTSDKENSPHPSSSLPKVFSTSPQDPSPVQGIWYPGLLSKSGAPRTSHYSPDPSVVFTAHLTLFLLSSCHRGGVCDVPSVGRSDKGCLGFEHEKSSLGEEMRKIREERDSAFAEKEEATEKYNDLLRSQEELISNHTTTEGKLASELEITKANS
ncbi:hypothetical protein LIER_29917 [Lithospermum erythrorhizon]|uniref:Uncharacterized protein n=1 Tax=Lithospermum erythrorhizon TaxID=34254 RepID=A0AAV3RKU7_LITER